jgi:hypothetical protein
MLTRKRKKDVTLPVRPPTRFSILASSLFMTGPGDAKVKVTDAKSVQVRMKSLSAAKRDMETMKL